MRLTPPKQIVFWISVVLAAAGVILPLLGVLAGAGQWLILAGFVLLAAGNACKGL